MAKASRSSRKQPAFDPSELSDLIYSPAVGSGVGSHLLTDVSTVDETNLSTVAESNMATVAKSAVEPVILDLATVDELHLTTVGEPATDVSTVDRSDVATVVTSPTAPARDLSTVVASDMSTVSRDAHAGAAGRYWVTEQGHLVPQGRVKRIGLAQDVINSTEEAVYAVLWNAQAVAGDEAAKSRVVQAGYDYLGKNTGLSKKTIQRIVAKLIDKDFIAIERQADIYQRSSTVYRVFDYREVLERHVRKGRSHIAKMGPGFSYVRRLGDPQPVQDSVA